jgi:hypothetical protein
VKPSRLVRSIGWLSLAWMLAFAAGSGVRVERRAAARPDATSAPAAAGDPAPGRAAP